MEPTLESLTVENQTFLLQTDWEIFFFIFNQIVAE